MPAKDAKAYIKRNKNDAADAEAICEAVRRPTMRMARRNPLSMHLLAGHLYRAAGAGSNRKLKAM